MMAYKVQLIALRCYSAQEADGDEIYVKVNEEIVFEAEVLGYKFADAARAAVREGGLSPSCLSLVAAFR